MHTITRKNLLDKARGVTAGMDLHAAVGEEAFVAAVNRIYDEDIFYLSKPKEEQPIRLPKRRLETQDTDPAKRARIDPASVHDDEMKHGLYKCTRCFDKFNSKEDGYLNGHDGVVCLGCWGAAYCRDCKRPLPELEPPSITHYPAGPWYGQCKPCNTRVVHLQRKDGVVVQDCDVYIGRAQNKGGWKLPASIWGNPFKGDGAVDKYETYVRARPDLMAQLPTLAGKRLGCWCKPKPCHGDVLVKLVKECI